MDSKKTLPFESNKCSIAVEQANVEGETADEWMLRWFDDVVAALPVRYANAYLSAEREAKNIVTDGGRSRRAVGVDYSNALPGLHWLNFFGRPYLELIGKERLLSAPAHRVTRRNDGVMVQLNERAADWNSAGGLEREQAVEGHLGRQYFFSKADPSRKTVAPDFWGTR